jgi:hypothetical protein
MVRKRRDAFDGMLRSKQSQPSPHVANILAG